MSYSRSIQVLVVEDEQSVKQQYETLFKGFDEVAAVEYAFSYNEGVKALDHKKIFHLVVLDLRLPEEPGLPSADGTDYGLDLLRICETRDAYPIPALLIISGHLDKTNQTQLQDEVTKSFWYGRAITKSLDLDKDIQSAISSIQAYCDVGVHLRDSGADCHPTITPREEDLLRRCVLHQDSMIGVDIKWWVDEYDRSSGWTKTLMGHFLFDGETGNSLPTFFKFFPAQDAQNVLKSALIMEQKLAHIKVLDDMISGGRSLLVTQKVGSLSGEPTRFKDILNSPPASVKGQIPILIRDVAEQVSALGNETPDQQPVKQLLCPYLDSDQLSGQWQARGSGFGLSQDDPTTDPVRTREALAISETIQRITVQSCHHGDLNFTNIAIDRAGSEARAYIFDAGSCTRHVNVRDLAMLEITSLLHQSLDGSESLVRQCSSAYDHGVDLPEDVGDAASSDVASNTLQLIREIRCQALKRATAQVYALMVFDIATMQLWGLAYTVSRNKIKSPEEAALLATLTSAWLRRVAPGFFASTGPPLEAQ